MSDSTPRVTKNDRYNQLLAIDEVGANQELVEFILHEQDLLSRKSKADGTPTKAQRLNEAVKSDIVGVLAASDEGLRSGEVATVLNIPVQKSTALLKQLVDAGTVTRETVGKVTTFTIA